MSPRSQYWLGAGIGGTIGGFLPGLWGGSDLSGAAIILSMLGGFAGIWVVYKLNH